MNKKPFLLKTCKENNGQCREKNEKLCKVKRVDKSHLISFTDRTEYDGLFNFLNCYYNQ